MPKTSAVLELHALQTFPPALLNRDDQGVPKDAMHGGIKRDRISSQCLKRAMRLYFKDHGLLPDENLSIRTRTLVEHLTEALIARGHSNDEAGMLAVNVVWGMGLLNMDPKNAAGKLTNVLLFISAAEIGEIADKVTAAASDLLEHALPIEKVWPSTEQEDTAEGETPAEPTAKAKTASKAERKAACPPFIQKFSKPLLVGLSAVRAVDIGLFGRFMAEENKATVHGALAVAHALGVHPMTTTLDYYTAVDDVLNQSGFLDTGYLSGPTVYRYAALDLHQLGINLDGDDKLAEQAVSAVVTAFLHALPNGKKTSTAPDSRPETVLAVLRRDQALSLVNAFRRPVSVTSDGDMLLEATNRLAEHYNAMAEGYGDQDVIGAWHLYVGDPERLATPLPGERLSASNLAARVAGNCALHLADRR